MKEFHGMIILNIHFLNNIHYFKFKSNFIEIKRLGLSILDGINNKNLKDLLSKMLKTDPEERISWDDYFIHPFFN